MVGKPSTSSQKHNFIPFASFAESLRKLNYISMVVFFHQELSIYTIYVAGLRPLRFSFDFLFCGQISHQVVRFLTTCTAAHQVVVFFTTRCGGKFNHLDGNKALHYIVMAKLLRRSFIRIFLSGSRNCHFTFCSFFFSGVK